LEIGAGTLAVSGTRELDYARNAPPPEEWRSYATSLKDLFNAAAIQLPDVWHNQVVSTLRTAWGTSRPGNIDQRLLGGEEEGLGVARIFVPPSTPRPDPEKFQTFKAAGFYVGETTAVSKAKTLADDAGRWAWMLGEKLKPSLPLHLQSAATHTGRVVEASEAAGMIEVEQLYLTPTALWMHILHHLAHEGRYHFLTTRRTSWDLNTGKERPVEGYFEGSLGNEDDDAFLIMPSSHDWYRCELQQNVFRASVTAIDLLLRLTELHDDKGEQGEQADPLGKLDLDAMLTHVEIAERIGVPAEPLRKKLDRWRKRNNDGWKEVEDRRPREPRYIYKVGAILPILTETVASGKRPAK
jgi:hypothetical protein